MMRPREKVTVPGTATGLGTDIRAVVEKVETMAGRTLVTVRYVDTAPSGGKGGCFHDFHLKTGWMRSACREPDNGGMFFIHSIQTYASVNRKGNELQEYILKFQDSLVRDREGLENLKEDIHNRIEELDAKYPRTLPLHFDTGGGTASRWYIHVKGKPDSLICIVRITEVKKLLGKGTIAFPGEKTDADER